MENMWPKSEDLSSFCHIPEIMFAVRLQSKREYDIVWPLMEPPARKKPGPKAENFGRDE